MKKISRKGAERAVWIIPTIILMLILLGLGVYLYLHAASGAKSLSACRGVWAEATADCPSGTEEVGLDSCESNGIKYKCCSNAEYIGKPAIPCSKDEKSGASGGASSGASGGTQGGTSSDTVIHIAKDDPTLPEWKSGETLQALPGTTYTFTVWLEGKNQVCSVNVREVAQRDSSGNIVKTNEITPAPSWFNGGKYITRENCNASNKKTITITMPSPPTAAETGKEFKMDVMAFPDTNQATGFTASATIYVKPQEAAAQN